MYIDYYKVLVKNVIKISLFSIKIVFLCNLLNYYLTTYLNT